MKVCRIEDLNPPPLLEHRSQGAQILLAGLGGIPAIFYLSPFYVGAAHGKPARGGVPILFPQFADRGILPKHGLVRAAHWSLLGEQVSQISHMLSYGLSIEPNDYPTWPYAARLSLLVKITREALCFELQVVNTGNCSFSWTGGLHPYFAVQDVLESSLSGVGGLGVQDRYDPNLRIQPDGDVNWTRQPFERLYDKCPPLVLNTGGSLLRCSASGFDQWMIWNPGGVGGNALGDLPIGDWRRFVCLEPVCVNKPVVLAPDASFVGTLHIVKV